MKFSSETEFQTWCDGVLTKLGVHFVHIPSKNKYVRKGILDLMCWYYGKSFIIELKVGRNKLDEHQIKEVNEFKKHKIPVYVVRNSDEFISILKVYQYFKK